MTTLAVRDLDVYIQASHILRRVAVDVAEREVVCLVGRNGAGKTTLLRAIMGYLAPRAGSIAFQGVPIAGRPTHEIARAGIGFAPEDSGIFSDLTVKVFAAFLLSSVAAGTAGFSVPEVPTTAAVA